jgi:hypothetical protein
MAVLKRIGIVTVATVAGGLLGFGLAFLFENGWFWGWQRVAPTPEPVASLRLINRSEVWVGAASGTLYYNGAADTCEANCWASVAAVPAEPARDDEVLDVFPRPCVRPPPLLAVVERLAECQREQWVDFNTVYARRRNGDLFVWRFTSGGEYGFLMYPLLSLFGAAVLFVVALMAVLVDALVRWLRRRRAARPMP